MRTAGYLEFPFLIFWVFLGGKRGLRSEPQIHRLPSKNPNQTKKREEKRRERKKKQNSLPREDPLIMDLGFGDFGISGFGSQIPRESQILQAKVGRLEQLLLLKNLRIDDLSRRLQQLQSHRR